MANDDQRLVFDQLCRPLLGVLRPPKGDLGAIVQAICEDLADFSAEALAEAAIELRSSRTIFPLPKDAKSAAANAQRAHMVRIVVGSPEFDAWEHYWRGMNHVTLAEFYRRQGFASVQRLRPPLPRVAPTIHPQQNEVAP